MRMDCLKYIKEDGRLNVGKIRHLPIDEKMKVMGKMTQEQIDEYWSKIPINESQETPIKIVGRYKMKDRGVDAVEFLIFCATPHIAERTHRIRER